MIIHTKIVLNSNLETNGVFYEKVYLFINRDYSFQ